MAGELAAERRGDRDSCFNDVVDDFWLGRFVDSEGNEEKVFSLTLGTRSPPMEVTRNLVWRTLGVYNRPHKFRDVPEGWNVYHKLAGIPTEDYGDGARNTLKNLCLKKAAARQWLRAKLRDGTKGTPKTHIEALRLRKQLKEWIEEHAKKQNPTTYTKQDFRLDARAEMRNGPQISAHMFGQVWPTADIDKKFKEPGRRSSTS